MRAVLRSAGDEQIQNRHADRDSVRDLLENARLRSVRNFRRNFQFRDSSGRVKNDGVGLGETSRSALS